jgi:hypothetical protein
VIPQSAVPCHRIILFPRSKNVRRSGVAVSKVSASASAGRCFSGSTCIMSAFGSTSTQYL